MSRNPLSLLLVVLALVATGASCEATRDLEGVNAQDPDSAVIIRNADMFPNLSILCVKGTAIVTTTREAAPVVVQQADLCSDGSAQ